MDMYFWASAMLLGMAAGVGLVVFLLIWRPTRKLLSLNASLLAARPFFLRCLFLLLLLGAISTVIGESFSQHENFMEYFWEAADNLQGPVLIVSLYLLGFAVLMTVLTAVLGRHRDQ